MISLVDIYNINESSFSELKSNRDPARGNKGKNREKNFKLVSRGIDPETGKDTSDVVYEKSMSNAFKDLYAEAQDFEILSKENPDDVVLYNISEELNEIIKTFRLHLRKKYPEEFRKISTTTEQNTLAAAGSGTTFQAGDGMDYATPKAFGDDEEKKLKTYKNIGYKKV